MIGRQIGPERDRHGPRFQVHDDRIFGIGGHQELCSFFVAACDELFGDVGRGERRDVAAQHRDFLDEPRCDRLMPRIGHQEHGLDFRN
jgi:hypothetical protein